MEVLAQQGLAWPNSLSINLETGKLIWVDASRDLIGMMNVDGTEMEVMYNYTFLYMYFLYIFVHLYISPMGCASLSAASSGL